MGGCLGRTRKGRFMQRHGMGRSIFPVIHTSPNGKPKIMSITRRTESSKYPVERKSTETPSVVVSERGLGRQIKYKYVNNSTLKESGTLCEKR